MVSCGVSSWGVLGPNEPILDGVNTAHFFSRATSSMFSNDGEQGCQVVDGVDVVLFHYRGQLFAVGDVGNGRWTAFSQLAFGLGSGDVACHYMLAAIKCTKFGCEFRPNLAC